MSTPPAVVVRPLADGADLSPLNQGNPLGWIADWWRGMDPDPDLPVSWWEATVDDDPAGFAALARGALAAGGHGYAVLYVLPGSRRLGAGTALRAAVEGATRGHLPGVTYPVPDDDPASAAALEAWGLTVSEHHSESVLDLTALDRAELERLAARPGLALSPLPELDSLDEAEWRSLFGFLLARFREAPDNADGGGNLTYAFFRELVTDRWCLLSAHEDGERVGVTVAMARPGDDDARNTFFTGVSESVRGRGVALALKARQAVLLADAGLARLHTQNMVGNEPILAANRRLGFVRDSGYGDVPVVVR